MPVSRRKEAPSLQLLPLIITQTGSNEKYKVDSFTNSAFWWPGALIRGKWHKQNVYLIMGPSIVRVCHTCQVWHPNDTRPSLW